MLQNPAWYREQARKMRAEALSKSKSAEHAKFLNELAGEWEQLAKAVEEYNQSKPHRRRARKR